MEFERALFRVHERTLLGALVRNQRRVQALTRLLGLASLAALCLLIGLHSAYVGRGECLQAALQSQHGLVGLQPEWVLIRNASDPALRTNRTALWADENADLFKCDGYYNNTKKHDWTKGRTHCGASGHTFLTCIIAHHKFGGAEK